MSIKSKAFEKNALLIVGAGGHGHVVKEAANDLGYKLIEFLDDHSRDAVGMIRDMNTCLSYENAFCGIGDNHIRDEILDSLKKTGFNIPVIIHPTAYVAESAEIESGTIVEPKAIVNANSVIGEGCIISVGAIIDHDVQIGRCCHINAGAIVKAGASISDFTKIDAGEVIRGY